jgi:membrane protein YdbS with pleckstrin-like domain
MAEWFVKVGDKVHGPLESTKLKQLASAGKINGTTEVSQKASGPFVAAANVKGLFPSATQSTSPKDSTPSAAPVRAPAPVSSGLSKPESKAPISDAVDAVKSVGGYVGKTLLPGEHVVYEGRLHWFLFLRPVIWLSIGILVALISGSNRDEPNAMAHAIAFFALCLCIAILSAVSRVLTYLTSEFTVTNKRVVLKQGFIRRNTIELMLNKVDALGVDQGLIGRAFNFGTVRVAVATEKQRFKFLADPLEFRRQVQMMQANA